VAAERPSYTLLEAAFVDIPVQGLGDQAAGLDRRIGRHEGAASSSERVLRINMPRTLDPE
jgi:hypothetical protein